MRPRLVDQYTYPDILEAYMDCRRRKRNSIPCFKYDISFEHNLIELLDQINNGTYTIGSSRVFVVTWPKAREVWAALFRDRIVHHLVCRDIAPFYVSRFIHTNCACIEGRGTLYAVNWLEKYCRSITENWHKEAFALQFDIKNFFVSVDRELLWSILAKDIGETSLTSRLLKQIIFHDITENAIVKRGTNFNLVPRHKSLWYAPKGKGLPIGDLPSQLCASGVYLDGLDKFCKHVLKIKRYVRYVDDGVALFKTRDEAEHCKEEINRWLKENRLLELALSKTKIFPVSQGINFVGTIILPFRRYVRNMSVGSSRKAVQKLRANPLDRHAFDGVNSYLGLMQHSNTFKLRKRICTAVANSSLNCDKKYNKIFYL